jgi:hypothetical protein
VILRRTSFAADNTRDFRELLHMTAPADKAQTALSR